MTESIVESSAEAVLNVAKTERIRVLHVDDDLTFLSIAKQCLEMQGEIDVDTMSSVYEASEKLKKTDYDAIVCDYQMHGKDGLEFLKELRANGNNTPFIVFTGKGREEIAVKALNLDASGYFSKHGEAETVYGELAHGIHQAVERKTAEMKIWEREERVRAIFSSSPDAIIVSDLHGNILDCNEATWKMFGFSSKEEVIGKSSFDLIAEKDRQKAYANLKKTLEQGTTKNLEYTLLKKDGEIFWGELSASILRDSVGNPVCFVDIMRDITEREKAESGELRLVYEDDGVGISAESKLKLFTEGFSTGSSTGFGLFLIRKMMDVYGWQIQETGGPGKGAKFTINISKTNLDGRPNYKLG